MPAPRMDKEADDSQEWDYGEALPEDSHCEAFYGIDEERSDYDSECEWDSGSLEQDLDGPDGEEIRARNYQEDEDIWQDPDQRATHCDDEPGHRDLRSQGTDQPELLTGELSAKSYHTQLLICMLTYWRYQIIPNLTPLRLQPRTWIS